MITPRAKDAIHKAWLFRILSAIADSRYLTKTLFFKGGTCAAMRQFLDRFSVDLDFDMVGSEKDILMIRQHLETLFGRLGLKIATKSTAGIQYFLKYDAKDNERNTIKLDTQFPPPKSNQYEAAYFAEIDRTLMTQTIESMLANKLVAVVDRWETHQSFAGRDIYDIHYFFLQGHRYNPEIIKERTNLSLREFFDKLIRFIDRKYTATIIQQDLNTLLPPKKFQEIRLVLKQETLNLLRDEWGRLESQS